jgi:type IX secretion system PorP/SprF family membrane protein
MKKNLINVITVSAAMLSSLTAFSQDAHFSQVEFSPLTLNPALAGAKSSMQGLLNYRSQWNSVAVPYSTIAASFDARFNENNRQKKGIFAGGINFLNDQAGDLRVNTTNVNINLAYHLILDQTSTLGVGLYTGYGQRSISPAGSRWGLQYDGMGYNSSIDSGEEFNNQSFGYLDAGAGILYSLKQDEGNMTQNRQPMLTWGFAVYHVNRPSFSYLNQDGERLSMRISTFINANIGIQNTRGAILPGIYYQRQNSAQEIFYGLYYKYLLTESSKVTGFNKPMSLYVGLFNRWKDAMVGKIMLEYDQFSAGFAYDINTSNLSTVSEYRGGFELFLRFNMGDGGGSKSRI